MPLRPLNLAEQQAANILILFLRIRILTFTIEPQMRLDVEVLFWLCSGIRLLLFLRLAGLPLLGTSFARPLAIHEGRLFKLNESESETDLLKRAIIALG